MSESPVPAQILGGPIDWRRSLAVAALCGLAALACFSGSAINSTTEAGVIPELPAIIGEFTGQTQEASAAEKRILPLDTVFARRQYSNFTGEQINCQIVLSGGEKRSIHRPEICLPGQGWSVQTGSTLPIKLADGKTLKVTRLLLGRPIDLGPNDRRTLHTVFLYWFVGHDRITPHHWERILLTSVDRVLHNTNHRWAYVVVSAPVLKGFAPGGKNEAETEAMLADFVRQAFPHLHTESAAGSL